MTTARPSARSSYWRAAGWAALACALLVPAIAMQFTEEVNWGPGDFLIMAVLLTGLGVGCELAIRLGRTLPARLLCCAVMLVIFLLAWAELAVGIFR